MYCTDGGGCETRRARITTRRARATDCNGKSKLGTTISYSPLGPVFLTNLPVARLGKLESSFYDISGKEMPSGTSEGRQIDNAKGRKITLTIPKNVIRNDVCAVKQRVPIILDEDVRHATWRRTACRVEGLPGEFYLHWIGDLDGDGRSDILMSYPDGTQSLMLSSNRATRIETAYELIGGGC